MFKVLFHTTMILVTGGIWGLGLIVWWMLKTARHA